MQYIVLFLLLICLAATLLPIIKSHKWWIRIFDYPRAQVLVLAMVVMVLVVITFHDTWWVYPILLLSLGVVVFQSIQMVKYTPFYPHKSPENSVPNTSNTFKVLICNVQMDNDEHGQCLDLINNFKPDIVLLTEVDKKWVEALRPLDASFPYFLKYPQPNTFGILLYSKLPLEDATVDFLVKDEIPSISAKIRLPSGNTFDFYGLHPEAPKPGTSTYERDTELLLVGRKLLQKKEPAVVAGDLNDVAWSTTSALFQKRTGLWDPREGRGFYNTFNVNLPLLRYPLDHFFYTKDFYLVSLKRLPAMGSDHFPLLLDLEFNQGEL